MIAILLLLQMLAPETTFQRYLREAQEKLGLRPTRIEVRTPSVPGFDDYQTSEDAAWVPYGPGTVASVVYVHPGLLRAASPLVLETVAFHEACHIYLGVGRRWPTPAEVELQHMMIDGCVEWVMGPSRFHYVMTSIPCGKWYPFEALRYNRRIGRERCREKR